MDEADARILETNERYSDIVSSAIKDRDKVMLWAMASNGVIAEIDYWDAQDGTISDERIGELCKPSLPQGSETRRSPAVSPAA